MFLGLFYSRDNLLDYLTCAEFQYTFQNQVGQPMSVYFVDEDRSDVCNRIPLPDDLYDLRIDLRDIGKYKRSLCDHHAKTPLGCNLLTILRREIMFGFNPGKSIEWWMSISKLLGPVGEIDEDEIYQEMYSIFIKKQTKDGKRLTTLEELTEAREEIVYRWDTWVKKPLPNFAKN